MKPFDFCVALFDNFWLLLLFVILEVALSFKSRTNKMAVLCLFIIMIFGHAIAVGHTKAFFLLGAFCLFSGFAFHFCDYSKLAFHENLIRRLPLKGDVAVYQTILRIMSVIYERGEIEERAFVQIVKSVYSEYGQFSEGDIKLLAIEINKKMLYEYSLITINATSSGYYAGPDSQLFSCSSLLQKIAVLPRMAVIFVLAILWLASPVDLIPDALPFGGLDDVVVALLSTFVIKKNIADVRQGERFR